MLQNLEDIGENEVEATFTDGTTQRFDVVVGADGINSVTREMVFGQVDKVRRGCGYCGVGPAFCVPEAVGWKADGLHLLRCSC